MKLKNDTNRRYFLKIGATAAKAILYFDVLKINQ
jgi:hypothetical protein